MRAARLRRSSDIETIRAQGRSYRRTSFVAKVRHTGASETRLAVTAPRSLGGSVARNRARRRVREAFRRVLGPSASAAGVDLLVTARPEAATAEFGVLMADASSLLRESAR